jgi:diguanylate cyclase (GGDEF)-like protein
MLLVASFMLLELRRDAWDKAEQTSQNLAQVIDRDLVRNIEIIDLSLQAVVSNLKIPAVSEASPELRQLILFDRAATARDMGVLLVIDEHGDIAIDAGAVRPRKANYADREYFRAHRTDRGVGLFIGAPIVSRLTGERTLPFTRRIDKADGTFGGVVLGTLKLSYFARLFDRIALGGKGAINLFHTDGTRIMRYPYAEADIGVNISGTRNFERFVRENSGSFVGVAVRDSVERLYTFTRIGALPLILSVSLGSDDVEGEWRRKAIAISAIVAGLCAMTIALLLLFGRELQRRALAQAQLARLSLTDALTGLPNRRRFDEAFAASWENASRSSEPLSLLIVDADHFKRFNDEHGHAVGDEVLKALAHSLAASVHRRTDLVCRFGGEEFAMLLPATDQRGALRIAERIHAEVKSLSVPAVGIVSGAVTVSIGLASTEGGAGLAGPSLFLRLADQALYAAKAAGRDRTEVAPDPSSTPRSAKSLRLVSQ